MDRTFPSVLENASVKGLCPLVSEIFSRGEETGRSSECFIVIMLSVSSKLLVLSVANVLSSMVDMMGELKGSCI